jgi:hypothetical protein
MGGFGSGRYSNGPTVESGLALDISSLLRQRTILPGDRVSGTLRWRSDQTGEQTASIGYEASLMNPKSAWVRLRYAASDRPQDYRIRLTTSPCHYGGYRWWWVCPLSGRRAAKLYLPPGATVFAARQVYGLGYLSQRLIALERSHERQGRLYQRLGVEYRVFEQAPPPRPKGMHRRTFTHLIEELHAARALHRVIFEVAALAVLARLEKSDAARAAVFDVHRAIHPSPSS